MISTILGKWLTLSLYVAFMGFCFCDGFKLHIVRKLIWFAVFLGLVFYSLKIKNEFDFIIILPASILLAMLLCIIEKRRQRR